MAFGTVQPYPEWRVVWERYGPTLGPGGIVAWDDLQTALGGLDPHRGRGYQQLRRFRGELQDRRGLQIVVLPHAGYRCALPGELPGLVRRRMEISTRHQRRAKRAAAAAVASVETPEPTREQLQSVLFHIAKIEQLMRRELRAVRQEIAGMSPPVATVRRALPESQRRGGGGAGAAAARS